MFLFWKTKESIFSRNSTIKQNLLTFYSCLVLTVYRQGNNNCFNVEKQTFFTKILLIRLLKIFVFKGVWVPKYVLNYNVLKYKLLF